MLKNPFKAALMSMQRQEIQKLNFAPKAIALPLVCVNHYNTVFKDVVTYN